MRESFSRMGTGTGSGWVVNRLSRRLTLLRSDFAGLCRASTREVTARTFVLTLWVTCAVATFPQAASLPPPTITAPGAFLAAQEIDPLARMSLEQPMSVDTPPVDTLTPSQSDLEVVTNCWGAARLHIEQAWRMAGAPRSIVVAVLDTGIDTHNPHLVGRIVGNLAIPSCAIVTDVCGHGTHVASTIAAMAPNSSLLSIKVADDRGFCDSEHVAEGIRTATNLGVAVINLSLAVEPSPSLESAIEYAWENGVVVVAAAGSPDLTAISGYVGGNLRPVFPAAYPLVIAVTGTDENDNPAPLANRAAWVDVAAPGDKTYAAIPGVNCGYMTGTSTAAAHVSGIAALLCGIARDASGDGRINDEVRAAIESTAEPLELEGMGHGIVNAASAVASLTR